MTAERRLAAALACGLFPLLWLLDATIGQAVGSRKPGWPYAIDFHPVWRAAHAYLVGTNPYPTAAAVLHSADAHPVGPAGELFVYPVPVAAMFSPLGALPYAVAAGIFTVLSVAAILLALWLLRVRDWRCYGIAFATPAVMTAVSWGTLTPLLVLAVAAAWRYRDSSVRCGLAVAAAIVAKLFLWPLVLWLLVARRSRAAGVAVAAAAVATVATWSRLGFAGMTTYPSLMRDLARVQAPRGETLSAIVGSGTALTALTIAVLACAAAWLRRERDERLVLAVFVLLAVWLSPIGWIHYFALVFPLVALWSRTFGAAWLVPLGSWLILSQHPHEPWRIALALAVSSAAVAVAARARVRPVLPRLAAVRATTRT